MKNISTFHCPSLPTYLCFFYHSTLLKFNSKVGEQEELKDSLPFSLACLLSLKVSKVFFVFSCSGWEFPSVSSWLFSSMRLSHYKNENMFEIQKSFVPLHKACNLRLLPCFAHMHRHTQTHTLYFLQVNSWSLFFSSPVHFYYNNSSCFSGIGGLGWNGNESFMWKIEGENHIDVILKMSFC